MLPTWAMATPLPSSPNPKDSGVDLLDLEEDLEGCPMEGDSEEVPHSMEMTSDSEILMEILMEDHSQDQIYSHLDLVLPSVGVNGYRDREFSLLDSIMDMFDAPSTRSRPTPRISNPLPRISSPIPSPASPPSPSSLPSSPSSLPISSVGGGFYKGGGNSFIN
ncbi:hypothetical protein PMAYCL1PPCAC_17744 [Pristionchus mayeri]|uniref:Uncharacterized protein n=1 Tax=Pristionchus mayeri TaxID=1317129 RepID=A0AAN5I0R8_9BILA|nr:hypothetical protein PMAYCL1PPCAC_17744 [Pristionchus mayeri]